jgi:hypothetical protein
MFGQIPFDLAGCPMARHRPEIYPRFWQSNQRSIGF